MTITEFAAAHRLKTRREDETRVILGKSGQLYEYSDRELGVLFIVSAAKSARTRLWNSLSVRCIASGMVLRQSGDAEGTLSFDPSNQEQIQLALRLAGVKRKRQLNPVQLAILASVGFKSRSATLEKTSAT